MKVLFCDNALTSLINFRSDVISHFLSLNYEVVLVAPMNQKNKKMEKEIPNGCKIYTIEMEPVSMNPVKDIKYFYELLKVYHKELPDIIFHYTIKPNIYGGIVAATKRIPYIPNVTGLGSAIENGGLLNKFVLTFRSNIPKPSVWISSVIYSISFAKI